MENPREAGSATKRFAPNGEREVRESLGMMIAFAIAAANASNAKMTANLKRRASGTK